jgi:hypothetical protein
MEPIIYLILVIIFSIVLYFGVFKNQTTITEKLENFSGDDLNVHLDDDYNI